MTQECYDQLVAELKELMEVELPRVKNELVEAREKGDLSENFEYHAAKREQGKLFSRIRFKQRVLQYARVMDTSNIDTSTVGLFRKVQLTNLANNAQMTYTIVNPHEANLKESKISIQTPIAQALLGKTVGDTVEVQIPAGKLKLRVDSISK